MPTQPSNPPPTTNTVKKNKELRKRTFITTDMCMWEKQKQDGTFAPHSIQVIDETTGQTFFINTGARIRLLAGQISPELTQQDYNKQTLPPKHSKVVKKNKK